MKIGIVLYDKVNLLNFAQISDFVRGLEGARVKTYALKPEIIDEVGLGCILKFTPRAYTGLRLSLYRMA